MRELTDIAGIPDFWMRVRAASHRLLALDYDGTLAPFRMERERALPLDGIVDNLRELREQQHTTLAIVSGRQVQQILDMMGSDLGIPIYGVHGWELFDASGRKRRYAPTLLQLQGLTRAIELAAGAGYEKHVERKLASVVLHTRGLSQASDIAGHLTRLWRPLAETFSLFLMVLDHGVELRARGRDKGTALAELHRAERPGTLVVYVGDDATDEEAFRYLKGTGIGIKVGMEGESEATGRVADPAAVRQLLRDWRDVTRVLRPAERNS